MQFQDVDHFTWTDRQGLDHPLVPANASCNLKYPAWMSNKGEVTDITQLPITQIAYGPLRFELEKVKVVIGPIICQPSEKALSIREQMFENQIEELQDFDRVIENKNENLKTKMKENSEKIHYYNNNYTLKCVAEESNYRMINNKCVYYETTKYNYEDAKNKCEERFNNTGRLFEPKSWNENDIAFKIGKLLGQTNWRVGINIFFRH